MSYKLVHYVDYDLWLFGVVVAAYKDGNGTWMLTNLFTVEM